MAGPPILIAAAVTARVPPARPLHRRDNDDRLAVSGIDPAAEAAGEQLRAARTGCPHGPHRRRDEGLRSGAHGVGRMIAAVGDRADRARAGGVIGGRETPASPRGPDPHRQRPSGALEIGPEAAEGRAGAGRGQRALTAPALRAPRALARVAVPCGAASAAAAKPRPRIATATSALRVSLARQAQPLMSGTNLPQGAAARVGQAEGDRAGGRDGRHVDAPQRLAALGRQRHLDGA